MIVSYVCLNSFRLGFCSAKFDVFDGPKFEKEAEIRGDLQDCKVRKCFFLGIS